MKNLLLAAILISALILPCLAGNDPGTANLIPDDLKQYYYPLENIDNPLHYKEFADSHRAPAAYKTASGDEVIFSYLGSTGWNGMKDVCVYEHYALCSYNFGLQILDISDSSAPVFVSQVFLPDGDGWRIEIYENTAFLADGYGGLAEIDISDPYNPILRNIFDTPGYCYDVQIKNNIAFVADGPSGLSVLDLSGTGEIGYLELKGEAVALKLRDNYLYLAARQNGLMVIDISDPKNPFLAASPANTGSPFDLDLAGDFAYLAGETNGLHIVNIADPLEPYAVDVPFAQAGALGVTVSGDYAYITYDSRIGLQIYNIENPLEVILENTLEIPGMTLGVAIRGTSAYVAGWYAGLQAIDISNPGHAEIIGQYSTPGSVEKVVCDENYIFIARSGWQINQGTFQIFSKDDPIMSEPISEIVLDGPAATDVAIYGNYAYILDVYNGLIIADITSPQNSEITGRLDIEGYSMKIAVYENLAFIGTNASGLYIVDITDKGNPELIQSFDNQGSISGIAVTQNYIYISDLQRGLQVIDIHSLQKPVLVKEIETIGKARDIAISGNYAYLADEDAGLVIYDLSNPAYPVQIANPEGQSNAVSVFIYKEFAYVTNIFNGMDVYNISKPALARWAGNYLSPGLAWDAAVFDDRAYLADYYGLLVLDMERPILTLSPESISFEANQDGYQPESQTFLIDNSNVGKLIWEISSSRSWLHFSPVEGAGSAEIEMTIDISGLIEDIYYDTIVIDGNAANAPRYLPVELTINPPNHTPEIAELPVREVDENSHLEFSITASDADNTIPLLFAENLPLNASLTDNGDGSGLFKFDPDFEQAGEYSITIIAIDEIDPLLSDTSELMVMVNNVNRAPVFESAFEDSEISEDENYELIFRSYDPDGDAVTLSCLGNPENSIFTDSANGTGLLAFNSDFSNVGHNYEVVFTAIDIYDAKVSQTMHLTITNRQLEVLQIDPNPPASGIKDVLISDKINVIFNERIDENSIDGNVEIQSQSGDQLQYIYDPEILTLIVSNGENYFSQLDRITITLLPDIRDQAGYKLGTTVQQTLLTGVAVYPGDADNNGIVDERDLLPLGVNWESVGPARGDEPVCIWGMYPAHQWENLGATYADIDGSGTIDGDDICGIAENWDMTHEDGIFEKSSQAGFKASLKSVDINVLEKMYEDLQNCGESEGRDVLLGIMQSMLEQNTGNIPERVDLGQNFPNPFNPSTTISYSLDKTDYIQIAVYDLRGRLVKVLDSGIRDAGNYQVIWNGTDSENAPAASGIYFYRLKTGEITIARKMLLIK